MVHFFDGEWHLAKRVIETLYGRRSKYEIVRDDHGGMFFGTVFYVLKDGNILFSGHFDSLPAAIAAARRDGAA